MVYRCSSLILMYPDRESQKSNLRDVDQCCLFSSVSLVVLCHVLLMFIIELNLTICYE